MRAAPSGNLDIDQDGLPDRQELALHTKPDRADTDGDGFTDGVEFALQTSMYDPEDYPLTTELSVALSARGEGGKLKLFFAAYVPDGRLEDTNIRFGMLVGQRVLRVPFSHLAKDAETGVWPGPGGGTLFTQDIEISTAPFQMWRNLTYFVVIGEAGQTAYASAAKLDLFTEEGVIVMRHVLSDPMFAPGSLQQIPGTSVHTPIPPDGEGAIPVEWSKDQVCFQETEVTGTSGAAITHEVTGAECTDTFEGYCSSDCSSSTGTTFETIDPAALLGG